MLDAQRLDVAAHRIQGLVQANQPLPFTTPCAHSTAPHTSEAPPNHAPRDSTRPTHCCVQGGLQELGHSATDTARTQQSMELLLQVVGCGGCKTWSAGHAAWAARKNEAKEETEQQTDLGSGGALVVAKKSLQGQQLFG